MNSPDHNDQTTNDQTTADQTANGDTGDLNTEPTGEPTDRTDAQHLRSALRDTARRIAAASALAFEAEGSNRHEYRLLRAVADGRTVRGPARRALARLEREGLVERIDGRSVLTADGAALLARLRAVTDEVQLAAVAGVTADDLDRLVSTLQAIAANLPEAPRADGRGGRHRFGGGRGHDFGHFPADLPRHFPGFRGHHPFSHDAERHGSEHDRGEHGHRGYGHRGYGHDAHRHDCGAADRQHAHGADAHRGWGRRGHEEHAFERGFRRGFRHGAGHEVGHDVGHRHGFGAGRGPVDDVR